MNRHASRFASELFPLTLISIAVALSVAPCSRGATLRGQIVDASSKRPLAARLYVQNDRGEFFHVESIGGTAVPYDVRRGPSSVEVHTCLTAKPFQTELPAGRYQLVIEKGKEYVPTERTISLAAAQTVDLTLELRRWINMAKQGWFSGETHVHRPLWELPTLQLAEDLNVTFPLTAWVTDSKHTPARNNVNQHAVPEPELFRIDDSHVFWPVNTEYEIFTVSGKRHALGAFFVLNHQTPLDLAAPPVGPIAQEAARQGGVLELDKHNWPWSIMLVPTMKVQLYELANNHLWRTEFLYSDWYTEFVPPYMEIERVNGKFKELDWIQFGLHTYYALLNCGFPMQPTAGTASGVHPVPLGYGRVYVKLGGPFTYRSWLENLLAGNSFVTTGPMLLASARQMADGTIAVAGRMESISRPTAIEVIINGQVKHRLLPRSDPDESGIFQVPFEIRLKRDGSSWLAVRAFAERQNGKPVFAHTAPFYFPVAGQPLRPRRVERDYLVRRVRQQITRNQGVLTKSALDEYRSAAECLEAIPVRK